MDLKNATISFAVVVDDNEVTYAAIYFDHCVLLLLGYCSTQWKRNAETAHSSSEYKKTMPFLETAWKAASVGGGDGVNRS